MSIVYKSLVESFGYTPIMEEVSLDTIMAAVGQEKDEQKRAATLNDIAWKENLPGLYDPVSGNYVRKQSMPAGRGNPRYNIAATASKGDDEVLSSKGLVPDNASTSTAIGRMFRGDDKGQYDQDVRSRSQAARGQKPPGQGGQPEGDKIAGVNGAPNISALGSEFGTDTAFAGKANDDLANALTQHGNDVAQRQADDEKPLTPPREAGIAAANDQSSDLNDKRKRYAELLSKATNRFSNPKE